MGKIIKNGISYGGSPNLAVDDALSDTSENPVQNKVVKAAIDSIPSMDEINQAIQSAINSAIVVYDGSIRT